MAWLVAGCGGGRGGGFDGTCTGLDLFECRLAEGCVADLCGGCFCDLQYRGCISELAIPEECPLLGCPSAPCCRGDEQCQGQGACTPPGAAEGCGACDSTPGDCVDDAGCTGTSICEPIRCSCTAELQCVPGCLSDDDCLEPGTACDLATSRCVARACGSAQDCPTSFDCDGGRCARRACVDDLDCDGFCVLGQCFFGALGECRPPVP